MGARAAAAALDALIPDRPWVSSHWSICSERLENRSISVRSSNPMISAAPERSSTGPSGPQALGERGPLGGQVQVIGRHQLGVQPVAVQGRPAAVRSLGGVLDQHVGVEVGVA